MNLEKIIKIALEEALTKEEIEEGLGVGPWAPINEVFGLPKVDYEELKKIEMPYYIVSSLGVEFAKKEDAEKVCKAIRDSVTIYGKHPECTIEQKSIKAENVKNRIEIEEGFKALDVEKGRGYVGHKIFRRKR